MILPITHISYWKYTSLWKQALTDKNNKQDYCTGLDHDHISGDHFLIRKKQALKYEAPYKVSYTIV